MLVFLRSLLWRLEDGRVPNYWLLLQGLLGLLHSWTSKVPKMSKHSSSLFWDRVPLM